MSCYIFSLSLSFFPCSLLFLFFLFFFFFFIYNPSQFLFSIHIMVQLSMDFPLNFPLYLNIFSSFLTLVVCSLLCHILYPFDRIINFFRVLKIKCLFENSKFNIRTLIFPSVQNANCFPSKTLIVESQRCPFSFTSIRWKWTRQRQT